MSAPEVRLELAVGRRVRAKNGRSIGRLEEVRATEFLIGPGAFLERLGMHARSLFGFAIHPHGYRARWDQVDLSDPRRPRLTCPLEELARLDNS
jgi:hypothetical protein